MAGWVDAFRKAWGWLSSPAVEVEIAPNHPTIYGRATTQPTLKGRATEQPTLHGRALAQRTIYGR